MEPLEGVRILDFSRQLAGAAGTRHLATFGAEVLRAEWPDPPGLDFVRFLMPADGQSGINRGGMFNTLNVDKRSFTINMGTERGRELARRLVQISDVIYENMTPRVMKAWGLDYAALVQIKPDIIYVSCSGFGQNGPGANYRSYGQPSAAHTGLIQLAGLPGRPPAGWGFQFGDTHAAATNATAVLMALEYRRATGRGIFIDSAQTQGNVTIQSAFFLEHSVNGTIFRREAYPEGNTRFYPPIAPHNTYRCGQEDDAWCAIAVHSEEEWAALKGAMGSPEWAEAAEFASAQARYANRSELDSHIAQWTRDKNRFELAEYLQTRGVRAGAVQNVDDRMNRDPQLSHRGTYAEFPHAEVGPRKHETVGAKLSKSPYQIKSGAPLIGQDNDYVYSKLLGFSAEEIEELKAADAIR
jgi:crotonobetainyl-CoA:carnitine CoA-transferase CaiB-like acyl-CoA transferase